MKKTLLLLTLALTGCLTFLHAQQASKVRLSELFNFGWKFKAGGEANAQSPALDDSKWRSLDLPHDFQFEQPWDESAGGARGFKAMGEGWYRKKFKTDPSWRGKRVLLDFEGIMLVGDVYLNGTKIGGTDYGYLGFDIDITAHLNDSGDNLLAVWASTGKKGGSRWYTGGGLFRDVKLIVKDSISIARHGIYISTPKVSGQSADVEIQVELEGMRNSSKDINIQARIFSPAGELVAENMMQVPKRRKTALLEVPLPSISINSPQLWSCENPQLYRAEIALLQHGKSIDFMSQRFGIRSIEYSKEFGFKLNGEKLFLKGIANHHDLGAVGAAAYEKAIARQMDLLKSFGFNHIRTSHNPYSEAFLRLADEKGILIVDELYDKWSDRDYWAGRIPWSQIWYKNIPEWIKRDRSHPSVIMWSFGNELQMREDLAGLPTGDWGVTTYRILDVLAKRYDKTRPTTVAMFPARANGVGKNDPDFNTHILPPELATVTEISSFNYRWMNYADYLKHAPDMIVYQSEATTNELARPFLGMDRDKMVGLAYWGAIEYWGESNGWPRKGWNYAFFDHALEPYPQAYLIKSLFSAKPLVHIGVVDNASESREWNDITVGTQHISSHWNRPAQSLQNLYTYTNADEVELILNGKSLGIQKNIRTIEKQNMIYWKDIPFKAGKILAIARNDGKEVARHELETTGKAVALKFVSDTSKWRADGMDLQYLKVYAVDNKGRIVPEAAGQVSFEVSGAAQLIAVDNGDHSSDELFSGNRRTLHNGFAMAVLRSEQRAGNVLIKARCEGLKPAEKKLATN